jgi:hypothetical protein
MFLAENRARNDASNRTEFLYSPTQKRKRINEAASALSPDLHSSTAVHWSCARTDAKYVDRDVQMKYDIAKNEEGPLRKTVKLLTPVANDKPQAEVEGNTCADEAVRKQKKDDGATTLDQHSVLDERFSNIETHLSIRYGELFFVCWKNFA